jgi:sugar lactone lactonase YvrE
MRVFAFRRHLVSLCVVVAMLTACTQIAHDGGRSSAASIPDVDITLCPCVYVANHGTSKSITVYAAGIPGSDLKPIQKIAGRKTGLNIPNGVAVDAERDVYVTSGLGSASRVTVYSPGASGNVPPVRTISGPATQLDDPEGIAVDSDGNVDVVNGYIPHGSNTVTIYAAGANGNVAPIRAIHGFRTKLFRSDSLALDSDARLYVANQGRLGYYITSTVTVYGRSANGGARPIRVISGERTRLSNPVGVALDHSGTTYVINTGNIDEVDEYTPDSKGDVRPVRTIAGSRTGLHQPRAMALDVSRKLYVANINLGSASVTIYARDASGDVAPVRIIAGPDTGLDEPLGIAVYDQL